MVWARKRKIQLTQHGGLDPQEAEALRVDPSIVLDLSQNLAPLPPPPSVRRALASCDYVTYPEPSYRRLRAALAQRHNVGEDWVLPGNGASELIFLLCQALIDPGDRIAIFCPTFGEYERAARACRARVFKIVASLEKELRWDLGQALDRLRQIRPRLLFLCCPNNPTGVYLGREEVMCLVSALPNTILALDEAFIDFVEEAWDSSELVRDGHILAIRSLTKAFSVAGIRLGYLLGRPELLSIVRAHQPPWSVNAFAEAVGIACAEAEEHLSHVRRITAEAKRALAGGLRALGMRVVEGAANFLLVEVADASSFRRRLLKRGVCVRDCTSFGLPQYVRVAVPHPQHVERVLEAFAASWNDQLGGAHE